MPRQCCLVALYGLGLVFLTFWLAGCSLLPSGTQEATSSLASSDGRRPLLVYHGNWCGRGWPVDPVNNPPPAEDEMDALCRAHDLCYAARGDFDCQCDQAFYYELNRRSVRYTGEAKSKATKIKTYFGFSPCWGSQMFAKLPLALGEFFALPAVLSIAPLVYTNVFLYQFLGLDLLRDWKRPQATTFFEEKSLRRQREDLPGEEERIKALEARREEETRRRAEEEQRRLARITVGPSVSVVVPLARDIHNGWESRHMGLDGLKFSVVSYPRPAVVGKYSDVTPLGRGQSRVLFVVIHHDNGPYNMNPRLRLPGKLPGETSSGKVEYGDRTVRFECQFDSSGSTTVTATMLFLAPGP